MTNKIQSVSLSKAATILEALKRMDAARHKLLIITEDDGSFLSLLSIGDIQRAVIRNVPLNEAVINILRHDITVAHEDDDVGVVKERMKSRRNEFMPVIGDEGRVVKIIVWEELFEERRAVTQIDLPVVIMAGGRGARLKPLTNIIPKPLIPIQEKTIIEDIMDRFVEHGCHSFHISVNYKADMIRYYFDQLNNPEYNISFFQEDHPLGTAGSLSLLKGKVNSTFFVSNCDILIDQDYAEILQYHRDNKNEITVVAALKHYPIPYGTIVSGANGELVDLHEKPELTFKINSGMYVLEPHIIDELPHNKHLDITDLITRLSAGNRKIGVFPVSENSWIDIGALAEYKSKGT
jgi:dTDP-glucose pyrophosphorylase